MTPDLYILRHGETIWNREGRMQGHLNAPLTPLGREQALRQGALLAARDLTGFAYYTSPLARAVQTAALALGDIADEIRTDDRLKEIDVGAWQGRLRSDFAPGVRHDGSDGDLTIYARAPGEGLVGVAARAQDFLNSRTRPSVVVCHGIISRFLRCAALDLPENAWSELPGGQGNVFYLSKGRMEELR